MPLHPSNLERLRRELDEQLDALDRAVASFGRGGSERRDTSFDKEAGSSSTVGPTPHHVPMPPKHREKSPVREEAPKATGTGKGQAPQGRWRISEAFQGL